MVTWLRPSHGGRRIRTPLSTPADGSKREALLRSCQNPYPGGRLTMTDRIEQPRAYSVRRLAEEWDCPAKTIYNMIERGELRYFLLGEKSGYRIPAEEVY